MDLKTHQQQDRLGHDQYDQIPNPIPETIARHVPQDPPPPYHPTEQVKQLSIQDPHQEHQYGNSQPSAYPVDLASTSTPRGPQPQQPAVHQLPLPRSPPSQSNGLPLPIVLPQTSRSRRGAFHTPFMRAYVPELASYHISQEQFLSYLDGLNECWIANPTFTLFNVAGFAMQQAYGVEPVQLAGIGVQFAAGLASAATSYARTRMYVKEMNRSFWRPRGLEVRIPSTKDMLEKVGYPPNVDGKRKLKLLAVQNDDDEAIVDEAIELQPTTSIPKDDPRLRQIRALEGYTMQNLDFDVPEPETPDNVLKRMGNWQAKKQERKAEKKRRKRRGSSSSSSSSSSDEEDKINRKLAKERRKMEKDLSKKAQKDPKEQRKIIKDFEKEERKLNKHLAKEERKSEKKAEKREEKRVKHEEKWEKKDNKTANKIRWVLIQKWNGEENDNDSEDLVASEGSERGSWRE